MEPVKAEIYKAHSIQVAHGVLSSTDKGGYMSDYRIYIDGNDMTNEVRQISNQNDSGSPDLLLCRAREIIDHLPAPANANPLPEGGNTAANQANAPHMAEMHTLQAPADIGDDADKDLFGDHDTGEDVGPVG